MNLEPVIGHIIYAIRNAPVLRWPFPHLFVREIFPRDFYNALREEWKRLEFVPLVSTGRVGGKYSPHRYIGDAEASGFFQRVEKEIFSFEFYRQALMFAFAQPPDYRMGVHRSEMLLIRDNPGYSLGPHTDSPSKILSALFYLPHPLIDADALGTSFYCPRDPGFSCPGGPHYPFENFWRVKTFPFVPNAMLAFLKTNDSFHGVEPVAGAARDLLLYDVRVEK